MKKNLSERLEELRASKKYCWDFVTIICLIVWIGLFIPIGIMLKNWNIPDKWDGSGYELKGMWLILYSGFDIMFLFLFIAFLNRNKIDY